VDFIEFITSLVLYIGLIIDFAPEENDTDWGS